MVFVKEIRCLGLYSYKEEINIHFSNKIVIVGPNNSGKTNLFRVLRLFIDSITNRKRLLNSEIYHTISDPFLEIRLVLSKLEAKKIVDFLSLNQKDSNSPIEYFGLKNYELLLDLFEHISVKLSWKRDIIDFSSEPIIEIEIEKIGLKLFNPIWNQDLIVSTQGFEGNIAYPLKVDTTLQQLLNQITSQNPKEQIIELFKSEPRSYLIKSSLRSDRRETNTIATQLLSELFSFCELPTGNGWSISFVSILGAILKKGTSYLGDGKSQLSSHVLDAIEDLKIQSQKGLFDETENHPHYVFNRTLFSRAISKSLEFVNELKNDGSNLPQYLFSLRNSSKDSDREKFEKIKEAFDTIFESDHLKIDVILEYGVERSTFVGDKELQYPKFPKIVILDKKLGKQFPLSQVGSGIREVIYLLTVAFGLKNSVIMLDEPAVHLHPPLMKLVLKHIENAKNDNQFLIITHLPELVHFELFDGKADVLYVKKTNQISSIKMLNGEPKNWFEKNRSRFKHQIDTRVFFGKCIILTEGETDRNLLGIAQFMESVDPSIGLSTQDVIIISVGSKSNFDKYQRYLDAYGIIYVILADSDAKDVFTDIKYDTITANEISGSGPIFLVRDGDIEKLMSDIDKSTFDEVKAEVGRSKPTVSYEFAKRVYEKDPSKLKVIKSFFSITLEKFA